jgi:hypothetical protein
MHFHLPKPLHGWREFAGEVGIIVIGVLIALGAEQMVETVHDRRVAQETREAVTAEINGNLANVQLRGTAEPCMARRLTELHALVDQWGRTGTFKTPLWVAQAPQLSINLPHYDAAASAGRLALLPRDEQYRIGVVVGDLRSFGENQAKEFDAWANLRMLQSGADTLSASDRAAVRQALQYAAGLDYGVRLSVRQLLPMAANYGFRPDFRGFHEKARRIWKSGRYTPAICAPIDMPPDQANALTGQQTPLPF